MALNTRVGLIQKQRLSLSPAMRHSLSVLRLSAQSLSDAVATEAELNPFLIVHSPARHPRADEFALENAVAPAEGLVVSLQRQIALQRADPATEVAAYLLVTELREDGYLDVPLADLAEEFGVGLRVLEAGLKLLQACEPAGIGARTLAEFLALRLVDAGIAPALAGAASLRLRDFAEERWDRLRRALDLPQDQLRRIGALLKSFPSAPVQPNFDQPAPLWPELLVERDAAGTLTVVARPGTTPVVAALDVPRSNLTSNDQIALFDRARNFAAAIRARRETLLRIGRHIVATQSGFLTDRQAPLKPVTRSQAAADLGMHPSTLGRALAGKALVIDHQVFALTMFFSHALPGADGVVSPFDVRRRIQALIAGESAADPVTDEAICATLNTEGVDIARRTVAKYRKCMRIPSSFRRKRRKAPEAEPSQVGSRRG